MSNQDCETLQALFPECIQAYRTIQYPGPLPEKQQQSDFLKKFSRFFSQKTYLSPLLASLAMIGIVLILKPSGIQPTTHAPISMRPQAPQISISMPRPSTAFSLPKNKPSLRLHRPQKTDKPLDSEHKA